MFHVQRAPKPVEHSPTGVAGRLGGRSNPPLPTMPFSENDAPCGALRAPFRVGDHTSTISPDDAEPSQCLVQLQVPSDSAMDGHGQLHRSPLQDNNHQEGSVKPLAADRYVFNRRPFGTHAGWFTSV